MPHLSKKVISQYLRTECKRQLRLNLSPDNLQYRAERDRQEMPPKQPPRPGLEYFTEAGEEWQAEKLNDLTQTFGVDTIIGDPFINSSGQTRYRSISLDKALSRSRPNQFIVESEYNIEDEFESAFRISDYRARFHLDYATLRPDIIEVLPARTFSSLVTPAGDLSRLSESDERLQLRVAEIKLTSEPSAGYFSEVAYYTMALVSRH